MVPTQTGSSPIKINWIRFKDCVLHLLVILQGTEKKEHKDKQCFNIINYHHYMCVNTANVLDMAVI